MNIIKELIDDLDAVGVVLKADLTVFGDETLVRPPTFANKGQAGYGRYLVNENREVEIDTPAKQNRRATEMLYERHADLLPGRTVAGLDENGGGKRVGELGHRAADAAVRASGHLEEAEAAFRGYSEGDARPMAEFDPLSLVFGSFNSRGEGRARAAIKGMYCGRISASGAEPVQSAGQYRGFLEGKTAAAETYGKGFDEKERKELGTLIAGAKAAERGFTDQPVPRAAKDGAVKPGDEMMAGVRVERITKIASVNLIRARGLVRLGGRGADAGSAEVKRLKDNRDAAEYALGLGLLCLLEDYDHDLRQGAQLVERSRTMRKTTRDGAENEIRIDIDALRAEVEELAKKFRTDAKTAKVTGSGILAELRKAK